jgi:MFS transporter, BCD family, chlorophyll transporter
MKVMSSSLSWFGIVRLGMVQAALGAIVVLTTSVLNRVMVVELAMPAALPGALVALHYAVQVVRPRLGHGSDVGGRCTPWIVGGMALLALGGVGATIGTAWMGDVPLVGVSLATIAFIMIGIGVGSCGTNLLVLMAKRAGEQQRAAAATVVWLMMIASFIVTTAVAGHLLDPFSWTRLLAVSAAVSGAAMAVTVAAVWNMEAPVPPVAAPDKGASRERENSFSTAISEVWSEPRARRFAIFVFVAMLAYSAQDLILEPYAGAAFGFAPAESTRLSSIQHGGVLAGMLLLALAAWRPKGGASQSMQSWTVGGCLASALSLLSLAVIGPIGSASVLRVSVFGLGVTNGIFAVAAIGSMMSLVEQDGRSRAGIRMGLWGAAQAVAFGLGGLAGTFASDLARWLIGSPVLAYAAVFIGEAVLFVVAAALAMRVGAGDSFSPYPLTGMVGLSASRARITGG